MTTKSDYPTKPGAIAVSLVMQRTFVGLVVLAFIFQVVSLVQIYGLSATRYSMPYALGIIVSTLLPAAYFGVSYYFGPKYPVAINRWFIAALRALMASTFAGALQTIVTQFVTYSVHIVPQQSVDSGFLNFMYNSGLGVIVLLAMTLYYLWNKYATAK